MLRSALVGLCLLRTSLVWLELIWADWSGTGLIGAELGWLELNWAGWSWTGLVGAELGWFELEWAGWSCSGLLRRALRCSGLLRTAFLWSELPSDGQTRSGHNWAAENSWFKLIGYPELLCAALCCSELIFVVQNCSRLLWGPQRFWSSSELFSPARHSREDLST